MDRELLLELGCEELPASWLPALTNQIGEVVEEQLRAHRLPPEVPAETYSTPRRLTVRISRVPERQTDLEELVNGPSVSAALQARRHADAGGHRFCGEAGRRGRGTRACSKRRRASTSRTGGGSAARPRWTCFPTSLPERCAG